MKLIGDGWVGCVWNAVEKGYGYPSNPLDLLVFGPTEAEVERRICAYYKAQSLDDVRKNWRIVSVQKAEE